MRLKKGHVYLQAGAFMLMLVYILIFTSHLFMLANLTTRGNVNHGSILTNRSVNTLTVQRTDKTIITKNNVTNTISDYSHLYIFLQIEKNIAALNPIHAKQLSQFLTDSHFSYLFNRVLKI